MSHEKTVTVEMDGRHFMVGKDDRVLGGPKQQRGFATAAAAVRAALRRSKLQTPAKLKAVRELATKEVEKLNAVLAVPVKTISEREARARVRNESAFMSNKRYAAGETNDG